MVQLADHLVGRAGELDRLEVKLQELEDGQPGAVEVIGAPGIGKSRLLGALAERAEARRILVLSGRAAEQERDLPFWVFIDAIDEYVEGAGARASAAAVGLRLPTAMAHRAAAAVALDAGDGAQAADLALSAAALAEEVGAPVEAAVARILAGRALAHLGQPDRAVAQLERAVGELDRCGALGYRAAAERELRRLGHRIHRRTRRGNADGSGVQSLTERELQIARLVVDRKTNREIAAELYLSPKTIETHIRNMFRKLDANSRVEVARTVERADRLTQAQG